ncbi:hypothetical protein B0J13DRAFT_529602 [Dactylonectria estremocensis]|uniref:Uncharacterized protein n=1 Tax=Dactylonectria estremocensis TaxID=1079267 RepID=A0A9P9E6T5_9HYPO|nr:hypothetical protein B0J13DRAFT_529602 [Dactylonectria estremocensis]
MFSPAPQCETAHKIAPVTPEVTHSVTPEVTPEFTPEVTPTTTPTPTPEDPEVPNPPVPRRTIDNLLYNGDFSSYREPSDTNILPFTLRNGVSFMYGGGYTEDGSRDTACVALSVDPRMATRKRQTPPGARDASVLQSVTLFHSGGRLTFRGYYTIIHSSGGNSCSLDVYYDENRVASHVLPGTNPLSNTDEWLPITAEEAADAPLMPIKVELFCTNDNANVLIDSLVATDEVPLDELDNVDFRTGQVVSSLHRIPQLSPVSGIQS